VCSLIYPVPDPSLPFLGVHLSRHTLVEAARRYVPDLRDDDVERGALSGIRAQALGRDGRLVDDFVFSRTERALHVRNAPSPGATSALAIARVIADELGVRA
jgi:(S)-2-hydroxyglutarate dehydrogenase